MPSYPPAIESETHDPGSYPATASLGRRVHGIRKAARLTLEAASAATGISRAALSKIERGEMSPTYDSLCKLAKGLRVDLAALVSERAQTTGEVAVTRAGDGAAHHTERFSHQLLAPEFAERSIFAFETEVKATTLDDYDTWDRHDSEDFLYVLTGAVAVHLEGRATVELQAGDSLQMDGRIPHALIALSPEEGVERAISPTRMLWVSVPYAQSLD
ncbi:MAG: XRE family transcriptional regulator [Pseudomonadota bacterium]